MDCVQHNSQEWLGAVIVLVLTYPWWSALLSILISSVSDGDRYDKLGSSDLDFVETGYATTKNVDTEACDNGDGLVELLLGALES